MNVLVVVLDAVRAKNCGVLGYYRDTTPTLDRLADEATVYRQARAPARWSVPSHASMYTGLPVVEHGVHGEDRRLKPGTTVWSDIPHDTAVFSYNGYVNGATPVGLAADFDHVVGYRDVAFPAGLDPGGWKGDRLGWLRAALAHDAPLRSLANGLLMKLAWDAPWALPAAIRKRTAYGYTPDDVYVEAFREWHAGRCGGARGAGRAAGTGTTPPRVPETGTKAADTEWAAVVNLMRAHHPHDPRPADDRWDDGRGRAIHDAVEWGWDFYAGARPWSDLGRVEPYYDAAVRSADRDVGRLLDALRERDDYDETLVVVTADHGEGFGERSAVRENLRIASHVAGAHESTLHVPLVVKYPYQSEGRTVDALATLTNLPRAIRRSLAFEYPAPDADPSVDPFVPDDGVALASEHGLRAVDRETARQRCPDLLDQLAGDTHVVYRASDDGDGGVEKHMRWQDRAAGRVVQDARTAVSIPADEELVADCFDGRAGADVAAAVDPEAGVSAAVERRLEELGYR